jgi:hypothetical protein
MIVDSSGLENSSESVESAPSTEEDKEESKIIY